MQAAAIARASPGFALQLMLGRLRHHQALLGPCIQQGQYNTSCCRSCSLACDSVGELRIQQSAICMLTSAESNLSLYLPV